MIDPFYKSPNLSTNDKNRFHIKLHSKPLSASAYLVDWDDEKKGKILLDSKILGIHFSDGYGLEFVSNSKKQGAGSLYGRLEKSYSAYLEYNVNIPIKTIAVNLDANSLDELIAEVISQTNDVR